jgi:hypothetical protein
MAIVENRPNDGCTSAFTSVSAPEVVTWYCEMVGVVSSPVFTYKNLPAGSIARPSLTGKAVKWGKPSNAVASFAPE